MTGGSFRRRRARIWSFCLLCSRPGRILVPGRWGRIGFATLARQAKAPVIALGGVRAKHRHMLRGIGAAGWAAIDGLTDHI